jgi:two-component system, OmpR family, response regulator PfeR
MSLPIKILVVEDDLKLNHLITALLEKQGCWVDHTVKYRNAVIYLHNVNYDLVLLDYNLEDNKTGEDLCKYMKKHNITTKVIMLSGNPINQLEELRKRNLINDCLQKPFKRDDLLLKIRKHINK